MSIKLLAFDLDGTTITEHKYLSRENRAALEQAAKIGCHLVPATGRMKTFIPEEITAIPSVRYAITANGAAVYDLLEDRAVYQWLIPNEKALEVQRLLEDYDVYIEYYRNGRAFTKTGYPEKAGPYFRFPESKLHFITKDYDLADNFLEMIRETGLCPEKINLPFLDEATRDELWKKLDSLGGLKLTSSIPDNIEINSADADKGRAVQALGKLLGVSRDEIMAIGDNGNDVTMLEAAGCSVAVSDGSPEALAAAKYHAPAHTDHGLAQAVERFILGGSKNADR